MGRTKDTNNTPRARRPRRVRAILNRRVPRDLKTNVARYGALLGLVALCMFITIGLVAAADNVTDTVELNSQKNRVEDGQFSTLTELTQAQLSNLENKGARIEAHFSVDYLLDNGSTLRVFKNREAIDIVAIDEGRTASAQDEIVLEKLYAQAHGYAVGDTIEIAGLHFTVVGVGSSPDYDKTTKEVNGTVADKMAFGTGFVTSDTYEKLQDSQQNVERELLYAYRLDGALTNQKLKEELLTLSLEREDIDNPYYRELYDRTQGPIDEILTGVSDLADGSTTLAEKVQALLDELDLPQPTVLESFIEAADNPRIAASADDVLTYKRTGLVVSVIVIVLLAYVISIFVVHSIDRESEVIGALYALGVSKREIMAHYLALPLLVVSLGAIFGTLIGFSPFGLGILMNNTANYHSFPDITPTFYPHLLAYGILVPPVTALIISTLLINRRLARSPLALLRREESATRRNHGAWRVPLPESDFIGRFRIRQLLREKRSACAICGGIFLSIVLVSLALTSYSFISRVGEENNQAIHYEYLTVLKYPPETAPKDTTAVLVHTLQKEAYGYPSDVALYGISTNNPYFDFTPAQGDHTLTITTAVARKFDLKEGDSVTFSDKMNDAEYRFSVDSVVPYSTQLVIFMDSDSARSLLGLEGDAYNALLSDTMPDVEEGRIASITSKADINEYADIMMQTMRPMLLMLITVSILLFVVVLYLMMKVMIDRATNGISLLKIFGYTATEVRKLYLDGTFLVVVVSTLIAIPLSKCLVDVFYPTMVANIAMGGDFSLRPWMFPAMIVFVMVAYACILTALMRKVNAIGPNEILKNRE